MNMVFFIFFLGDGCDVEDWDTIGSLDPPWECTVQDLVEFTIRTVLRVHKR